MPDRGRGSMRRVVLAALLAVAAVLATSCGPDEPEHPELTDYAGPPPG